MWVEVTNVDFKKISESNSQNVISDTERMSMIKEKIMNARKIQEQRMGKDGQNKNLTTNQIREFCRLDNITQKLFIDSAEKLKLSVRSHHKILKLARTIADIEASEKIKEHHILEALRYRSKY